MLIMIRCCNIAISHGDILFRIIIDLVSTKAPPDMHAAKAKKKLLYWRNPTDPKIRPDPTFFFLNKKKILFWL